jgi:monofunctional chorismate mutase
MRLRGVRGATTCDQDAPEAIREATRELLMAMEEANGMRPEDVAAIFFSLTGDLTSAVPAAVAREMGYAQVPMMDLLEAQAGPGVARCIRVLSLWNTDRAPEAVRHIYLRGARELRPDLSLGVTAGWS